MYLYMKHVTVETKLRKNNAAIPKHGLTKRLDPPYIMVTTINTWWQHFPRIVFILKETAMRSLRRHVANFMSVWRSHMNRTIRCRLKDWDCTEVAQVWIQYRILVIKVKVNSTYTENQVWQSQQKSPYGVGGGGKKKPIKNKKSHLSQNVLVEHK